MTDKLSINIKIDGRNYPLKIDREEEEKYRKAAKIINETVLQYRQRYANHDAKDFITMAAFQFVLKNIELENKVDPSPFIDEVRELNEILDEYLTSKS